MAYTLSNVVVNTFFRYANLILKRKRSLSGLRITAFRLNLCLLAVLTGKTKMMVNEQEKGTRCLLAYVEQVAHPDTVTT